MEPTCFCCHPDFLKRFLQIYHNLTAVGKCQRHHIASTLTVQVDVNVVVDAVTRPFNRCDRLFSQVQILKVGHYNPLMVFNKKILGASSKSWCRRGSLSLMGMIFGASLMLTGCGQKGPLFLVPADATSQKTQAVRQPSNEPYSLPPPSVAPTAPSATAASAATGLNAASTRLIGQ
jgi:predicted small lipoprotein YifL